MNRTLKTSIISIALAGGGVIGLGTIAAASYGDEPPTLEETVDDGSAETDADADESSDDVDPTRPPGGDRRHRGHRRRGGGRRRRHGA